MSKDKKANDMVILTVRLPKPMRDKLDSHIDTLDSHISRNMWITQLIEKELKKVSKNK